MNGGCRSYLCRLTSPTLLLFSLAATQSVVLGQIVVDTDTVVDLGSPVLNQQLLVIDGVNPPTVLDFLTSSGGHVEIRDTSQVNVLAGSQIGPVEVFDEGRFNLIDGLVDDDLFVNDFSHVNIFEDGVVDEKLKISGSATVNIHGGAMEGLFVLGSDNNSIVNVRGGEVGELIFEGNATINFFGLDFELSDSHLTGVLSDGHIVNSGVTINDSPHIVFHAVPEPTTATTVVLGCLGLSFGLRRKHNPGLRRRISSFEWRQ